MFPLREPDRENPVELFQIWLNLPARDKMVEPHFSMLWSARLPTAVRTDARGRRASVTVVTGRFEDAEAPAPPQRSWAGRADSEVAIWTIRLDPGAELTLPPVRPGTNRSLYVFSGVGLTVSARAVPDHGCLELDGPGPVPLAGGPAPVELLLLQGQPIREPVAQHGPFVMTTREELRDAYRDFERTRFGGWPWPSEEPVHPRDEGRFAKHPDGRVERPT
jgi:hypothetical protein